MTRTLIKAKITACPNKRITGGELRRLRKLAGLTEDQLGARMGSYREQIYRWEKFSGREIEFVPPVMQQLLDILGARSL